LDRAARESDVTNPKLKKSILTATTAAEKAAALTNQMLAFARKQPAKPICVAVNELISNLTPLLRNALGEHGLTLNLDPRVGNVWADRNQFEQALLNLISVILLFDGLAIRLFDGFELLECCVTRYVGGATELCNPVMWDMRDTARRWSKFAET